MHKTKTIFIIVAVALVATALVGVTYAQFVNTQTQNSTTTQTPPPGYNGYYQNSNDAYGYYPCYQYGAPAQQAPAPYQYSGMGMCGRYW